MREVSFNSDYVPLQSHTKAKPEYKANASISSFLSSNKISKNEIEWAKLAIMLRQQPLQNAQFEPAKTKKMPKTGQKPLQTQQTHYNCFVQKTAHKKG